MKFYVVLSKANNAATSDLGPVDATAPDKKFSTEGVSFYSSVMSLTFHVGQCSDQPLGFKDMHIRLKLTCVSCSHAVRVIEHGEKWSAPAGGGIIGNWASRRQSHKAVSVR